MQQWSDPLKLFLCSQIDLQNYTLIRDINTIIPKSLLTLVCHAHFSSKELRLYIFSILKGQKIEMEM